MSGLCWTYDQLVNYLGQLADAPGNVNPIIRQLLTICPGSCVWGLGGHSAVLKFSPTIAAKICLQPGDERLRHEQEVFALLDGSESPHLVQCFFRGTETTFLEAPTCERDALRSDEHDEA